MIDVSTLCDEINQMVLDFNTIIAYELDQSERDTSTIQALRGFRDRLVFTLRVIHELAGNPRQFGLFD